MENIKMAGGDGPEKKSESQLEDANIIKEAEAIKETTSEELKKEENSKIAELQDKINNLSETFTNPEGNLSEVESKSIMDRIKFLQRELKEIDPDTEIEGENTEKESYDSSEEIPTLNPMTPEELKEHEKEVESMNKDGSNLESLNKEEIEKLEVKEISNESPNESNETPISNNENVDSKKVSIFSLKTFTKWKMLTGHGFNNFFLSRNEKKLSGFESELELLKSDKVEFEKNRTESLNKLQEIIDSVDIKDEKILEKFRNEKERKEKEFEDQEAEMQSNIEAKTKQVAEMQNKVTDLKDKSESIRETFNSKVNQKIEEFKSKHGYESLTRKAEIGRESLKACLEIIKQTEEKIAEVEKYLEISKELKMSKEDVKFFKDEISNLKNKVKGLRKAESKLQKNNKKNSAALLKLNTGIAKINKIKTNLNTK
jgi:hypothetical protein